MINELKVILEQVHEPNEFKLISHNLSHPIYFIFKLENVKVKDLRLDLRTYRKEHARFDVFVNGQYILERDYITEYKGTTFFVKFFKSNFPYLLDDTDDIKVEGDLEQYE